MVPGVGTLVNVVAILAGSAVGALLGDRLPARTRDVVTDGLGLVVLLVAGLSAAAVLDPTLREDVGAGGPVLVVLAAVVIGGVIGSALRLERRLEGAGAWLRRRLVRGDGGDAGTHRFVEGFVTASLVFCVGPLAILGSLSDGLGTGIEQLVLKAAMDGLASIAFAAALGWGVAASAIAVGLYQGAWTLVGLLLGGVMSDAEIAALTATGGLLLVGISLRLWRLRDFPVADLLPALVVAPLLVAVVAALR